MCTGRYNFIDGEPATRIFVAKLKEEAVIPTYAHIGDSGFSVCTPYGFTIWPLEYKLIKTGLAFMLPPGYELQLRSRSGNTLKMGLVVAQGTATIDSNYRGEVGVIIYNRSSERHEIPAGYNICQGVIAPVPNVIIDEMDIKDFDETSRGDGAYGSTDRRTV